MLLEEAVDAREEAEVGGKARDGGATSGLETAELQQAIDEAGAAGGGTVRIPPGVHCTSTLRLRSGVTLCIEAGAVLTGHDDPTTYEYFGQHAAAPDLPAVWNRSLILCDGVEDVTITGGGVIDGADVFDPNGEERMRGPHTIMLRDCRRIRIHGVRVRRSANYAIMFYDSNEVDIDGVTIEGGWDGVHFRGQPGRPCRDVTISNCRFYTGDDAIAGCYWANVVITGCVLNSSCNAIRLIGPATGLIIHDCLIYGPGRHPHRTFDNHHALGGILLQPGAWMATSGELDDVVISDVTMHRVQTAFQFVLKPGNRGGTITMSRVDAHGVYYAASSVESWADAAFERVTLRDITIDCEETCDDGEADSEVTMPHVGLRPLPAWGLYARGVRNLSFENVRLTISKRAVQPAIRCVDVERLTLDQLRLPLDVDPTAAVSLQRVGEFVQRG